MPLYIPVIKMRLVKILMDLTIVHALKDFREVDKTALMRMSALKILVTIMQHARIRSEAIDAVVTVVILEMVLIVMISMNVKTMTNIVIRMQIVPISMDLTGVHAIKGILVTDHIAKTLMSARTLLLIPAIKMPTALISKDLINVIVEKDILEVVHIVKIMMNALTALLIIVT